MRRTTMAVLAAAMVAAVLAIGAEPAVACSCGDATDRELLRDADLAFVGSAVAPDPAPEIDSTFDPVTWRFEVEQVFKGEVAADQEIQTSLESSACGASFPLGVPHLVFAYRVDAGPREELEPGGYTTYSCGSHREVAGPLADVAGVDPHPPEDAMLAGPSPDAVVAASDDGLFLPAGVLIALGVLALALGIGAVVWSGRRADGPAEPGGDR